MSKTTRDSNKLSLKEEKSRELDLVDDIIRPEIGSIREVRINGFLDKKSIWNGGKWENCCRSHNCKKLSETHGLCKKHNNDQILVNIVGEKRVRGGKTYRWDGKQWKMLCSVHMCETSVANIKIGKCTTHIKNPNVLYSSHQHTVSIFNQLKEDMDIERRKKTIKQRQDKKKEIDKEKRRKRKSLSQNELK
jgi:hypothetical protein